VGADRLVDHGPPLHSEGDQRPTPVVGVGKPFHQPRGLDAVISLGVFVTTGPRSRSSPLGTGCAGNGWTDVRDEVAPLSAPEGHVATDRGRSTGHTRACRGGLSAAPANAGQKPVRAADTCRCHASRASLSRVARAPSAGAAEAATAPGPTG